MPQTISTEPLAQILKSIAFQKRTGMLYVEQLGEKNAERGEIYFENGYPMRARAGQETGKAAMQRINGWRQLTCSFQGMSRPFPAATRALVPSSESKEKEARPLAQGLPVPSQRGSLEQEPEQVVTEQLKEVANQARSAQEKQTRHLTMRETGVMDAAKANPQIAASPVRTSQPLILRGERLEEYTPKQPARPSRHIERWTTHLVPPTPVMPPRPSATPYQSPLPGEEVMPGRTAVFKTRAMVITTQAIQRMERRERIIFILLDGRRTIQDIARLTHQPEADVEQTLIHLTKRGYAQCIRG